MAFDGNGNYSRIHNWTLDAANLLDINAAEMDAEDNSIAGAFNITVTRDGQGKMAADFLPTTSTTYNLGTSIAAWKALNGIPVANFTTQAGLGQLLAPLTAAEAAASITPTFYFYPELNILRYGATGTLTAADMVAINAALSVGTHKGFGEIRVPAGSYLWSATSASSVPPGVKIKGDGRYASVVQGNNVAATIFYVNGTGASIESMGFSSSVTNTSGCFVQLAGTENSIEDFHMSGDFNGLLITGVAAKVRKGWLGAGASGGNRIIVNCGDASPYISDVLAEAQSAPFPASGLCIQNCVNGYFSTIEMLTQGASLAVIPGNGQQFEHSVFAQCQFDGGSVCAFPMFIQPSGTGIVGHVTFIGCWSSDGTSSGGLINNTGTGLLTGLNFIEHTASFNTGDGLQFTATAITDTNIRGGYYGNNTAAGLFFSQSGDIKVLGANCGATAGFGANGTFGIVLASTLTAVLVMGCDLRGNTSAGLFDGTSGITKIILGNLGYNVPGSTGFGTPTGGGVVANFPGSSATLPQTSETVAQILIVLKEIGLIGA